MLFDGLEMSDDEGGYNAEPVRPACGRGGIGGGVASDVPGVRRRDQGSTFSSSTFCMPQGDAEGEDSAVEGAEDRPEGPLLLPPWFRQRCFPGPSVVSDQYR